jgi:hypothetical protein
MEGFFFSDFVAFPLLAQAWALAHTGTARIDVLEKLALRVVSKKFFTEGDKWVLLCFIIEMGGLACWADNYEGPEIRCRVFHTH